MPAMPELSAGAIEADGATSFGRAVAMRPVSELPLRPAGRLKFDPSMRASQSIQDCLAGLVPWTAASAAGPVGAGNCI